jgi:dGTPase
VVDVRERDGSGLNLTEPVRDGILRHTGPDLPATLEGKIVRLVDRIAYINHDIDDALRAGLIEESDLPREEIAILGPSGSERIDLLVQDLVEHSERAGDVVQGERVGDAMARLSEFMFKRVYLAEPARREQARVSKVIQVLFDHFMENPQLVVPDGQADDQATSVTDYLAGMTDRFCIRTFKRLVVPREFRY